MKEEMVTRVELLHALREKGFISLNQITAIVLEINGIYSVLPAADSGSQSTLENVKME